MAGPLHADKLAEVANLAKTYLERASLGAASLLRKASEKVPDAEVRAQLSRKVCAAASSALEGLQESEAFNLVDLDPKSARSLADVLSTAKSRLQVLALEVGQLPPATALALTAVVARAALVLSRLGSAAALEVLQTLILRWRVTLAVAATPGFLILRRHRERISQDIPTRPPQLSASGLSSWLRQACLQAATNLRPFPPLFWVSAASSALLSLQAVEALGLWAVSNASRFRRTILMSSVLIFLGASAPEARRALAERALQLTSAEALSAVWQKAREILQDLAHAVRVAVLPRSTPRRVPPGGELGSSPKRAEAPAKGNADIQPPVFGGS
mmetsp:Transcript_67902/g.150520  ORF Transcript_67902/g.150520 Transcript_67902/m.150520 type:complete len:330 (+) Transcript_67902:36-1025(+)